jgi:hypothetical protein
MLLRPIGMALRLTAPRIGQAILQAAVPRHQAAVVVFGTLSDLGSYLTESLAGRARDENAPIRSGRVHVMWRERALALLESFIRDDGRSARRLLDAAGTDRVPVLVLGDDDAHVGVYDPAGTDGSCTDGTARLEVSPLLVGAARIAVCGPHAAPVTALTTRAAT